MMKLSSGSKVCSSSVNIMANNGIMGRRDDWKSSNLRIKPGRTTQRGTQEGEKEKKKKLKKKSRVI